MESGPEGPDSTPSYPAIRRLRSVAPAAWAGAAKPSWLAAVIKDFGVPAVDRGILGPFRGPQLATIPTPPRVGGGGPGWSVGWPA